jgi:hypothetical protein
MRYRVLAASLAIAALPMTATAQHDAWHPARTPDGQPDLQGVWTNATITPFERPAEFADKPYLTEEEARAYETRIVGARTDAAPRWS